MAIGTTIPAELVQRILPLIMNQKERVSKLAQDLIDKVQMLPENVKCDDPEVQQLLDILKQLQQNIEKLKRLLELINRIVPIMQNVGIIATVLQLVQLAIPAVPGVPPGPIAKFINILSKLIDNIKSAIECLKGVLGTVDGTVNMVNNQIGKSINKLGSICNNDVFNVTTDVALAMDKLNNTNNSGLNSLLDIDSEFYQDINVSDEDIDNRIQLIEDLIQQQRDLLLSIKEAPSQVINQQGIPNNDIGDEGDYYIDSITNSVYGPKNNQGWEKSSINL